MAIAGDEHEMERNTIGLPHQQDRGYSTTDTTDGAGAVRRELARVHHAQVTLAIDDSRRRASVGQASLSWSFQSLLLFLLGRERV